MIHAVGTARRAHADHALRRDVLGIGSPEPRRHHVVPPAALDDRLGCRGRRKRERHAEHPGHAHDARAGSAEAAPDVRLRRRPRGQRILDGATILADQSGIPHDQLVLVNGEADYAHNDPAGASPNDEFLRNLTPFLNRSVRSGRASIECRDGSEPRFEVCDERLRPLVGASTREQIRSAVGEGAALPAVQPANPTAGHA